MPHEAGIGSRSRIGDGAFFPSQRSQPNASVSRGFSGRRRSTNRHQLWARRRGRRHEIVLGQGLRASTKSISCSSRSLGRSRFLPHLETAVKSLVHLQCSHTRRRAMSKHLGNDDDFGGEYSSTVEVKINVGEQQHALDLPWARKNSVSPTSELYFPNRIHLGVA
jgi:hypothetical protein